MTIELYGTARLRAGVSAIDLEADTLGEALESLASAIPALSGSVISERCVLPSYKISLNGEQFISDPETPLAPGDHLLILSADAGG